MASVTLEALRKEFKGGVVAVEALDLQIDDGEFVVLLGPSGCGKTTTLQMIAGLEEESSGAILFDGERVNRLPTHRRDIAMVFQSYALYPNMSVFDNLAFGLRMRKTREPEVRERVSGAAAMLGIEHLLRRKPAQLSGGQRQRVALGRAIVRQPRVFLLDEPLSNVDAKLRTQMRLELKALHQRLRATFIYVTHDQVEAMSLGDKIAVMNDGVLQQYGTPTDIYHAPANLFVATFIGSPAMNIVDGTICVGGQRFAGEHLAYEWRNKRWPDPIADRPVKLGFRASDVKVSMRPSHDTHVSAAVAFREPLGSDLYLTVNLGSQMVVVRTDPDFDAAVGQTIHVSIPESRAYLFDADAGGRMVAEEGVTV